ncbi:flagellar protein FlgN [Pseudoneobacillus sp. C159]
MDSIMAVINILNQQVETHKRLLDIAKEKRTILVEGHLESLQTIMLREGECVEKIQKLEEQRMQFVQKYIMTKGLKVSNYSLEELIQLEMVEPLKNRLQFIAKQLRELIEDITLLNESNQQLIQTSLSYIQYSIAMFVRKEPAIGYGPNNTNRYASLLDAKV